MKAIERSFRSWDDAELFYRAWLPDESKPDKALLLFHRGHEHSGRWHATIDSLGLSEISVFAWDARGHGRSAGVRGEARELRDLIKDVDVFVKHIGGEYGIALENMLLLAHSLAAVTVGAWVHDYAPPIRGLVLAAAAFKVRLYVPFAVSALRLQQKICGSGQVKSYVRAQMLTRDKVEAARYATDPLIFRQIAINLLLDLHDTAQRLVADAGAIDVPVLMLAAGCDSVVSLKSQREFFRRLGSSQKELQVFPEMRHAMFHDLGREQVIVRVRHFARQVFAAPRVVRSLRGADRSGYTCEEYGRLQQPSRLPYRVARAALGVGARLSDGIALGWRTGFDSGESLDYVYRNQAAGLSPFGKIVDVIYLNSVGWRGIRQRKAHLQKALREVIADLQAAGEPVRILDLAAGPGRYVLETMHALGGNGVAAVLRDYEQANVLAARALAQKLGLTNVEVDHGDAFDRMSLAAIEPRATIGIVSGLYELFPSNSDVLESLGGLATAVAPGGYLIYTNQPWHPQLKFIACVLHNREGKRWIMRRRTTAEIDELVASSGFEKRRMEIDRWGMFTVTVARRRSS